MTNLSAIIGLLPEDVTTVSCQFPNSDKLYVYKIKKELAVNLEKDDILLVATEKGFPKCVYIVAIHEESEIDLDSPYDYKWAFAPVPMSVLGALEEGDQKLKTKLRAEQRKNVRNQAIESLGLTQEALTRL